MTNQANPKVEHCTRRLASLFMSQCYGKKIKKSEDHSGDLRINNRIYCMALNWILVETSHEDISGTTGEISILTRY